MKIAIVGAGAIARVHMKALLSLDTAPAAICDIDPARARELLDEFSMDLPIFTDYERMLTEFSPEVVHICTPHHLHADMVVSALEKNVHVLCEKPLCIREEEIPRILAAERKSSATLGVCHQNRYNPANLFFKDHIAGKAVSAAHGEVVWRRDREYYRSGEWRGKWATEGGGVLINQALHTLDLCQWFFGLPTAVTATTATLAVAGVIEVEDTAACCFLGETPFTFFATNGAAVNLPVCTRARVDGIDVVLQPHSVVIDGKTAFREEQVVVLGKPCYGNGHLRLLENFYRCLKDGEPFPINGEEAVKVIRLILAVYKSHGKQIPLHY